MTLLYNDARFLHHETGDHPENAARIRGIAARLDERGLAAACVRPEWERVSRRRLIRVHAPGYVDSVFGLAKCGGGELDEETIVSPASYDVALLAAGAACDAVERVLRGEDTQAVCLLRPPGHHARFNHAMGFCLFNNVAIAAHVAVDEFKLDRVLVVDWDIHHGNGTQETFYEDPRVGFLSIHRHPFYPHTGAKDETGGGDGLGATLNIPVEYGTPRGEYLRRFAAGVETMAERLKPQLILVSTGFDPHRLDPIGDLGLEVEDFAAMTRTVLDAAGAHAGGRVVTVLEGGYNPAVVTDAVEVQVDEMRRRQRRPAPGT